MRTQQRLTGAYESARVVEFDGDSRFALLSDCHRGDGSLSDEFTRNQNIYTCALQHYYRNDYTYIEVGDGDELWEQPKFSVIKDAHYEVLEVIKKFHDDGRFILLWGNHNNYISDPSYVERHLETYYHDHRQMTLDFLKGVKPCEAVVLRDRETRQEVLVVHGHQGDFVNDQLWLVSMLSLKYFWRHLHALGVRNPASPVKNAPKRHKIEKNFNKWIAKNRTALVCGHTHRLKYPRVGELPYFNAGCCIYPTSVTAIEIADRMIRLVRWRIVVGETGVLEVARQVIRGPDDLAKFDIR